jgi:hypothetical protein
LVFHTLPEFCSRRGSVWRTAGLWRGGASGRMPVTSAGRSRGRPEEPVLRPRRFLLPSALFCLAVLSAPAEVMLQWFETEWDEIYRRLPEVAAVGYDSLWVPPPTKGPTGRGTKWGNVGYNLYDRFDLGDVPQRGSLATRYGTRGSLRAMVDAAHRCDVEIIPDIVMNHNGNGPDFRAYPGMKPEDFHVQWEPGHANTLNYKRGPRMGEWYHGEGYGGTLWQDLVSLIDIRTEPDNRFTGGNNTPGWNFVSGASFLRHVGQYDRYPYYPSGYVNENAAQMLSRWIAWLGNAVDFDGLRLDAGKHVPYEFFGTRGSGFLHEAQWNFNQRRGYTDSNGDEADDLFSNYLGRRNDLVIFAEILSYQSELAYWFGGQLTSVANNTRNPMRFLDYPLKQKLYDAFSNGNLASLTAGGGGIPPALGITYAWGHDEAGPSKINLAYAYLLTHIGYPMVYFTGNNITWADHNVRTWMRPGYDSQALGDQIHDIPNLVWIHQQFVRGNEYDRWNENDFFAYERYQDKNGNGSPDAGEGLLLVALNDSGWDQTRNNVTVSFPLGTWLHDYTGHNLNDIQVYQNGSALQVNVTVPGNSGQGWVCYAPRIAEDAPGGAISVTDNGAPAGTMTWVVPGGIHSAAKTTQVARVTSTNLALDVRFLPPSGGAADFAALKWGDGSRRVSPNAWHTNRSDNVLASYQTCDPRSATNWYLNVAMTDDNVPEGLNTVRFRVFNQRDAAYPELFNTFTKVLYVDRRGPDAVVRFPAEGQTLCGEGVALIENPDGTAYGMTVSVDGGAAETAHEIMRGQWKFDLRGLNSGTHTMQVVTTEANWANPRQVINTGFATRVFQAVSNANSIALNLVEGETKALTFFPTVVTAPGAPDAVRLYWDGREVPLSGGGRTNFFNGEVLLRDNVGNVATDRLWGAFVNGQHFFEAERVDGGVTSRVCRRVVFNLYGINAIDSDGDSLPDNVEMPFIDSAGAPGPDAPWPGDSNKDFIPNYGETWTRLNPYNHSTYYTEQWDDQLDSDGDGYKNGQEVLAGYAQGNIYLYSIYDRNSAPTGTPTVASVASWIPQYPARGEAMTIVYRPNYGPLGAATQIWAHVGHSAKTFGEWQEVANLPMAAVTGTWQVVYNVPSNATSVDMVFFDNAGTWDNNNGSDWHATVRASTNRYFTMDGLPDSADFLVFPDATKMKIYAAVRGQNLYVATWAVNASAGGGDHFIYVTDEPGNAVPTPWGKAGKVFFKTDSSPYLSAEGENGWNAWNNVSGAAANGGPGNVLEGEFNLLDAFGRIPEAVYVAAAAYETGGGGGITSQGPYAWEGDNNLDVTEFLRVPIASVRDADRDGFFDGGKPQMWTVVGADTNDANYGLRRFFVNELAGETAPLTVILQPNAGPTCTVSDVELFSNLNRRDFAKLEEDASTVTTASRDTYHRAYPMAAIGGGRYSVTMTVAKCGAYRLNARYRVNGGAHAYYTDHGLRRDGAVVVSPRKALELAMYELNPMNAEATNDTFYGRSTFRDMVQANTNRYDAINTNHFTGLGVNMIWLQPIHPVGGEGRETDPATGMPYDPGSPYAVRNYWKVNAVLGDPCNEDQALAEFTNFVGALDAAGVGVMLDGTFNHSAWDCEIGEMGVRMGITNDPAALIRAVRPQWYSRKNEYGEHATYYQSGGQSDIAAANAPDRIDFGKWLDAADFFFGRYDCLVQGPVADTNDLWSSRWYKRYLFEEDRFEGHDAYTRELWEYFASYPLYWLEKTGHPAGTPKAESWRGIDGLRCDFAQGLPSQFWEYCINRTRSVKWDFLFMAESLDGNREINGNKRHGVGYRSSRHFDVLNENLIFYWRDRFFNYFDRGNAQPYTEPTRTALTARRDAYDAVPVLLNLTSHDELYPAHDPYRVFYAYCELAAVDGVPLLFYGQEAGAQNDYRIDSWIADAKHNFARYETNFGKSIPNFKRYNDLVNVWSNRDWQLQDLYSRVNRARLGSPALRSQGLYFLERKSGGTGPDPNVFAVAKFEQAGVGAGTQQVVFACANNNYWEGQTNRWAVYDLNVNFNGRNRFGIQADHTYNVADLMAADPNAWLWSSNRAGADLLANGLTVGLTGPWQQGRQAQFLRLVDTAASYPDSDGDGIPDYSDWDDDNDGLPDDYEIANGLSPTNAAGVNGASGDKDGDGMPNDREFASETAAGDGADVLRIEQISYSNDQADVTWRTRPGVDYKLQGAYGLEAEPASWTDLTGFRTALSTNDAHTEHPAAEVSNRFYRVRARR